MRNIYYQQFVNLPYYKQNGVKKIFLTLFCFYLNVSVVMSKHQAKIKANNLLSLG